MPVPKGTRIGGRQKGTPNKLTQLRVVKLEEMRQAVEQALPSAFAGDSHALLMAIYKNEELDINLRMDAAKTAIGYEKPRLQSVQANVGLHMTHEDALAELERRADGIRDAAE